MSDPFATPPFSPANRAASSSSAAERAESSTSRQSLGFTPVAAIAYLGQGSSAAEEERTIVRVRLQQLAVIYVLIFGMTLILRPFLFGLTDPVIASSAASMLALVLCVPAVLAWWPAMTVPWLRRLELAMTLALAGLLSLYFYRRLMDPSVVLDPARAVLIEKNTVLLLSMLILFHGIFVPKDWRRAAAVGFPLALSSLGVVLATYLAHRDTLAWMRQSDNVRVMPAAQFALDTLFLLLLAAVAAGGAHMFSRLRGQLTQARRFG
jgi:hypothetical protein